MTNEEAIKTLKANYPDACFEQLREAVDAAISALKAQQAAGDAISRRAALDALRTCYDTETVTMSNGDEYINYEDAVGEIEQLPSAQPETHEERTETHSCDCIERQAVEHLDRFTKIYCRDKSITDDLAFRCGKCEFEMPDKTCLVKVMARKLCPDYKDFGAMGDL